jgi:predicted alpha/beta superfamily hydrolase
MRPLRLRTVLSNDRVSLEMIQLRTFRRVWSAELRNRRTIDVYLPPSYSASRRRYPVLYMQDGQNLSDPTQAFAGTWTLPHALEHLASEGIEPIVVGIHNIGTGRAAEYSPFRDSRHGGGRGQRYVQFIARTLKPRIDRRFRTEPARESTVIGGSSLGGLIGLYAFARHPRVFGRVLAMSPALWFGDRRIFPFLERSITVPRGRLYVDVGTAEGIEALRDARRLHRLLLGKRYDSASLRYLEAEAAPHAESAWGARLPDALRFLLR